MTCPNCSTENPAKASYCRECGNPLATDNGGGRSIIRFGGAALLSAFGLLFILAGIVEGQLLAFALGAPALGIAYWLFNTK